MTYRVEKVQPSRLPEASKNLKTSRVNRESSFQEYLYEEIKKNEGLKISAHAKQRIKERHIEFQESDMNAIQDAMTSLEEKGARESLILYRDMALIASIKNRTIITAMDQANMDVVTNIDSALVIK